MREVNNLCYGCNKKDCKDCNEKVHANFDLSIDDEFVEALWKEIEDIVFEEDKSGQLILAQQWRGFPVGEWTQDDWFEWVDNHHSKGVGWVFENI